MCATWPALPHTSESLLDEHGAIAGLWFSQDNRISFIVLRSPRILHKFSTECTGTSKLRSQRRRYQCLDYVASNGRMIDELERIRKEAALVSSGTIPTFALWDWGKPRITSVNTSGVTKRTCSVRELYHELTLRSKHNVYRSIRRQSFQFHFSI
jgi:hypothetical protein